MGTGDERMALCTVMESWSRQERHYTFHLVCSPIIYVLYGPEPICRLGWLMPRKLCHYLKFERRCSQSHPGAHQFYWAQNRQQVTTAKERRGHTHTHTYIYISLYIRREVVMATWTCSAPPFIIIINGMRRVPYGELLPKRAQHFQDGCGASLKRRRVARKSHQISRFPTRRKEPFSAS